MDGAQGAQGPPPPPPPPPPPRPRFAVLAFAVIALSALAGIFGWPALVLAVGPLMYGIVLTSRRQVGIGVPMIVLALIAPFLGAFAVSFVVKPYRIPSPAMVPTLHVGDKIMVNRVGGDPARGDIVVFRPPLGADTHQCGIASEPADGHPCGKPTDAKSSINFIKRVVGLPGDTVFVKGNRAYVNGKPLDEHYVNADTDCNELCNLPKPITIPPGHFFMLGDNRGESDDSRDWGPVPKEWIIGTVFMRYAPLGRIAFM